jgi:hypothetical protein
LAIALSGVCLAESPQKATSATDIKGFEPPKPNLEFMARFTVDLSAPV